MQLIELRCDLCFKVQFTRALMGPRLPTSLPPRDTLMCVCVCGEQLKRAAARIKIEDTQCDSAQCL